MRNDRRIRCRQVECYIGLERLVEQSKQDYYECLNRTSQRWHEGRHELTPWLNVLLAIIRRSYGEFEQRAGQVKAPRGAKTDLVSAAIAAQTGPFRVSDIQHACPGVSLDMIRRVLKDVRGTKVECLGRGQSAQWRKLGN
jgi:hypothetical protein